MLYLKWEMIGVLALILKSLPFYKAYIKAMMMPEHLEKCTVTTGVLIYALVEMSLGKQSFRLLTVNIKIMLVQVITVIKIHKINIG